MRPCILFNRLAARAAVCLALALAACSNEPTVVSSPDRPVGPLLAIGTDPVSGARIETNKDDYAPGEVVHLAGFGWAANETIALFMSEEPNTHEDVTSQVVADSTGAFSMHFYDVEEHDLGVTFTLTATGLTSGSRATAVFTDGRAISAVTLNGVSAVTVAPSASISAEVIGALTGNSNNTLGSIGIKVYVDGTLPSTATALVCYDVAPNKGPSTPSNAIPFTETFPFNAPAPPSVYDVLVISYSDNSCGTSAGSFTHTIDDGITVVVANSAPVVSAGADAEIDEGGTFSQNGSFTDPDANSWTATVDYGDGSGVQPVTLVGKTFSLSHLYTDNGTYNVTVTVDDGTASGSDGVVVTVNNVAPVVSAGADATINEGGTFAQNGSFTDPGTDTWTATVDYGDGSGVQSLALSGKDFSLSHTYADNGSYTVIVTVTDDDTGTDSDDVLVTVSNVAPTITSVTVPLSPVAAGPNNVTVTWAFTDPGADTWTCAISWDTGLAEESATYVAPKSCSATKTLPAGIYTVTVRVTDDDGGTDTETATTYIVVFDPQGGFVTGGGSISSPAGAYPADGLLSGKATFGFVSKYQKGATTPTGNTEFQFHVASMNFKSTAYEWLVVAGARGQYKGSGTINGSGDYGFLLTAIDGQLNGGGGTDKFRIKIWDKATSTIVYDNQMGVLEDSPAATVIIGGSIVIHSK